MYSATRQEQKELMAKGVSLIAAAVAHPQLSQLEERINYLENAVDSLRLEIASMKHDVEVGMFRSTAAIDVTEPPSSELIDSVASYMKEKGEAYPSDIADALDVSLKEVFAALSSLKEEEKVGEA